MAVDPAARSFSQARTDARRKYARRTSYSEGVAEEASDRGAAGLTPAATGRLRPRRSEGQASVGVFAASARPAEGSIGAHPAPSNTSRTILDPSTDNSRRIQVQSSILLVCVPRLRQS